MIHRLSWLVGWWDYQGHSLVIATCLQLSLSPVSHSGLRWSLLSPHSQYWSLMLPMSADQYAALLLTTNVDPCTGTSHCRALALPQYQSMLSPAAALVQVNVNPCYDLAPVNVEPCYGLCLLSVSQWGGPDVRLVESGCCGTHGWAQPPWSTCAAICKNNRWWLLIRQA